MSKASVVKFKTYHPMSGYRTHEYFGMVLNKIHNDNEEEKNQAKEAFELLIKTLGIIETNLETCVNHCNDHLNKLQKLSKSHSASEEDKLKIRKELKKLHETYLEQRQEYTKLNAYILVAQRAIQEFSQHAETLKKKIENIEKRTAYLETLLHQQGLTVEHIR